MPAAVRLRQRAVIGRVARFEFYRAAMTTSTPTVDDIELPTEPDGVIEFYANGQTRSLHRDQDSDRWTLFAHTIPRRATPVCTITPIGQHWQRDDADGGTPTIHDSWRTAVTSS